MGEIVKGVIHGKSIELAVDPGWQDGEVVEMVIRCVNQPRTWGEGIRNAAGALGRMTREDFADLEEIFRERRSGGLTASATSDLVPGQPPIGR
jgi:hypothetical protein